MKLFKENTVDAVREKHVPVIESIEGGVRVKVGSDPHPMEDDHYIEWIEIDDGLKYSRKFLEPGQKPEAVFNSYDSVIAREYCNKHGLWKS
jgi:superoxide reductase